MAFLEWRRFTFFDIHKSVDNGKIAESLQDTNIKLATSGNSHVVLCDSTGWAHIVSRSWENTSFKAYELSILLAQQLPHDPYLVTIGNDEAGTIPMIKVWDWSRTDRHGNPHMCRETRAVPAHLRPTVATALAVHENKSLIAVGFADGSVVLYRGDVTRQQGAKMRNLQDTNNHFPITSLAFHGTDSLYAVSRNGVSLLYLDGARIVTLDSERGAAPQCSVLTEKRKLLVATDDGMYCYTAEGRGPAYAFKGKKVRLDCFRSYLVITTSDAPPKSNPSTSTNPQKLNTVTILDIQNKFIVFSMTFDEIDAVLTEWGSFYILTKSKEVIYLSEKDLQSKLQLLFKKNSYDVAIKIASSQHYDSESLTEIYKQYGDHLYTKGDLKGAIEQYVKTIGWLETSYVIRKYLVSGHLEPLIQYLEELHKKGYATEDHTTLLLTCYVKIDQHDQQGKLKEFINSKDKVIDFDVDVAIKVVRQVSPDDALHLALKHKRHDLYLKIVLEEKKSHKMALDYIADLDFDDADAYMKKYGHILLQYEPEDSTKFLKLLCTDYKPRSKPLVSESTLNGSINDPDKALADDFIHMFLSNSEKLIDFLEYIIKNNKNCSKLIYNALIEHYIHVWAKSSEAEKIEYESRVLRLLKEPEAKYDRDQILVICQMRDFKPGVTHLYEANKLWQSYKGLGGPELMSSLLSRQPNSQGTDKFMSPILLLDHLTNTTSTTLGDVRKYLTDILKTEADVIAREEELVEKYKKESEKIKTQIKLVQNSPITFQGTRCVACNRPLELPTVHFLCQHSFHQHCFQSFSESESECPVCAQNVRRDDLPSHSADTMHARLLSERDPFGVVSEYFGRGLFNKLTVITETPSERAEQGIQAPPTASSQQAPKAVQATPSQNYGPGAEAKIRLQEGQSKQLYLSNTTQQSGPKSSIMIPVPEGRMRIMEQTKYGSSIEANITDHEPIHVHTPISRKNIGDHITASVSPKISSTVANAGKNPFGDDDDNYDESKNPFADEDADDATNPFSGDDDYDKSLNPFS